MLKIVFEDICSEIIEKTVSILYNLTETAKNINRLNYTEVVRKKATVTHNE